MKTTSTCLLLFLSLTSAPIRATPSPSSEEGQPARAINVVVDPRIELLSVIQYLSGYGDWTRLITRYDLPYKKEVAERFAPFKEHRAVKLFDEMAHGGFTFDGPPNAILHLEGPPEFKQRTELSAYVCGRAGSREKLEAFFEAMRSFHTDSTFQAFFDEHAEFYNACVADTKAKMQGIDIQMLEDYYGLRKHGYTIILAPLFHPGGFGPEINLPDGSLDIFSVNGPQGMDQDTGRPSFGTTEDLRYLVWHEFSHSFLNPIVDQHIEEVNRSARLFEPLAASMARQAYKSWDTCVKEHLVRAATVRFSFRELGEDAGQAALKDEKSRRFDHVEALAERLKLYEQQRDQYLTINDFAWELLAVFDEAVKNAPPQAAADKPKVKSTVPANGAKDVDVALAELRIEFDQDMNQGGYSFVRHGDEGEFPATTGKARWESPRICILPVKLKPATKYFIGLNTGRFTGFASQSGQTAEAVEWIFTTADPPAIP